jgi:outer membrane lipopolysaccharide assembly protein LptE/RlpB
MRQGLALAALALLGACGFQLQGRQVLPAVLSIVHVEPADQQSGFTRALRAALSASGARLATESADQVADVHILRDDFAERVLSVDARNIPTDYELTYTVEIQVRAQQRDLMPAEKFELSRIYSFDERKLLAKEREKQILREALARDLASVVTRRLSTLQ